MPTLLSGVTEYLELDGVPCSTAAWRIVDHTPLLNAADQRGDDDLLPHVAGTYANRRRNTVTAHQLPMIFGGLFDSDGVAAAIGRRAQMQANVEEFVGLVVEPPGMSDGTREAELHLPDSVVMSGPVHVTGLRLGRFSPVTVRAVLEVSIPAGRLVVEP